ncbi:MAG: hypothetical protein ACJ0DI_11265, partial [bacterium]
GRAALQKARPSVGRGEGVPARLLRRSSPCAEPPGSRVARATAREVQIESSDSKSAPMTICRNLLSQENWLPGFSPSYEGWETAMMKKRKGFFQD